MAEEDSPSIARLRVRIALREAREAAGLTQAHVAEGMEWSQSKVIRIENGDNSISIADLRGLLTLLGVRDRDQINSLLADARIARKRQGPEAAWWQEPRFKEQMSDALRRFVEYEFQASEIRSFNIIYVHGPLQTAEYAKTLTGPWTDEGLLSFSPAKVKALVEARQLRREAMLQRLGRLQYYVLVDQSVLMRTLGGPKDFLAQLRQIVELAGNGLFQLRMLPFDFKYPIANNGSFELLRVGSKSSGSEVMYRENGPIDEIVENSAEVGRHRRRFDQLWEAANSESDTIAFIQERIEILEAGLAR